jgi:chemotaxis protein histidine kinase CheA
MRLVLGLEDHANPKRCLGDIMEVFKKLSEDAASLGPVGDHSQHCALLVTGQLDELGQRAILPPLPEVAGYLWRVLGWLQAPSDLHQQNAADALKTLEAAWERVNTPGQGRPAAGQDESNPTSLFSKAWYSGIHAVKPVSSESHLGGPSEGQGPASSWAGPWVAYSARVNVHHRQLDSLFDSLKETQRTMIRQMDLLSRRPDATRHIGKILDNWSKEMHLQFDRLQAGLEALREEPGPFEAQRAKLQAAMRGASLQPVGQLFLRVRKHAREAVAALQAECQVVLEGQETSLDGKLNEALLKPLLGWAEWAAGCIEGPPERLASGKELAGKIILRARKRGSGLYLQFLHDGRVPDMQEIEAEAREAGWVKGIPPSKANLLGMALRDAPPHLAGRDGWIGRFAGLRREIETCGGRAGLAFDEKYVCLELSFPESLASCLALVFRQEGQVYAAPLDHAEQFISGPEWLELENRIRNGQENMALWKLSERLGLPEDPLAQHTVQHALIVRKAGKRAVLPVEETLGQEDLVFQGLERQGSFLPGVTGLALDDEYGWILVLDVPALFGGQ